MTSFARTPEGRAAAERMMREFGHTMGPFKPRPGFPGRSPATPQPLVAQPPASAGLGSMPANSQQLGQMQGMLQGTPIGGLRNGMSPAQLPQGPTPQQPTGRCGRGVTPATQMPTAQTAPSVANQMRGMGLAGMGLQQMFGNKPAGMKKGGAVSKTDMKKGEAVKKKASSYKSGGSVSSASKRADGCAIKGKTKGRMV